MPILGLHLTELPVEILEQIFSHLSGRDIIRAEAISRQFRALVRSSPTLQCRRELFLSGLTENLRNSCGPYARRVLCKEHARRWSDAANVMKVSREIPLEFQYWNRGPMKFGRNLLANYQAGNLYFLRVPQAMSGKPIEQWTIPIPFDRPSFTAYPPEDVLIAAEKDGDHGSIRVHLLNLLDGSPYRAHPSNVFTWTLQPLLREIHIHTLSMTASRLMMCIRALEENYPNMVEVWRLVLWDWRTGDLVFDRSGDDESRSVGPYNQIAFLDEFRVAVTHYTTELFVFNTLVPQGHPENLRRFKLPPKHLNWYINTHLNHCGSPDEPLNVDPAQAIFLMDFSPNVGEPRTVSVLQLQSLINLTCSTRTDDRVPWDEWGSSAITMELPHDGFITVHGSRMLVRMRSVGGYRMQVFNFFPRGDGPIKGSDGSDGGIAVAVGRSCKFEGYDSMECRWSWSLQAIGDSIVSFSGPSPDSSFGVLHVLDLM